jgi:hypothetical protein
MSWRSVPFLKEAVTLAGAFVLISSSARIAHGPFPLPRQGELEGRVDALQRLVQRFHREDTGIVLAEDEIDTSTQSVQQHDRKITSREGRMRLTEGRLRACVPTEMTRPLCILQSPPGKLQSMSRSP